MRGSPHRLRRCCFCLSVVVALAATAKAGDIYWKPGPGVPGDWFEPTNWNPGKVPTNADAAYISSSGTIVITYGDAAAAYVYGGYSGSGTISQSGGTLAVSGEPIVINGELWPTAGELYLGYQVASSGTYELSGSGELRAVVEYVGFMGTGVFRQTGGKHIVADWLCLGAWITGSGTYELSGTGELTAGSEQVGLMGTGGFTQSGGSNSVTGTLFIGGTPGFSSTYLFTDGKLSAESQYVGYEGTGTFTQNGGVNTVGSELVLGYRAGSSGTYELDSVGAQLSALDQYVGYEGAGTFVQSAGSNQVAGTLWIGYEGGSNGTYETSGGTLDVANLVVGGGTAGTLEINDASAQIAVSQKLRLRSKASIVAVSGAAIHMTGAAFENESTDPAAMAGLANLKLIFEGGAAALDSFEVAGRDFGAVAEGWIENFVLGGLTLGGADAGRIQLVDLFDNQPDWEGQEALYVEDLAFVGPGSGVDLNGLNLYFRNGGDPKQFSCGDADLNGKVDGGDLAIWQQCYDPLGLNLNTFLMGDFNLDGKIDGGDLALWQQNYNPLGFKASGLATAAMNPEPASLCLLALGAAALLSRRRRT